LGGCICRIDPEFALHVISRPQSTLWEWFHGIWRSSTRGPKSWLATVSEGAFLLEKTSPAVKVKVESAISLVFSLEGLWEA
jgi:hypothetical protein